MDEQTKAVLRRLFDVIERLEVIDASALRAIADNCPTFIFSRLRAYPEQCVSARIDHLRVLISAVFNPAILGLGEGEVISAEGSDESYPFDHDILFRTDAGILWVDVTSDARLVPEKTQKGWDICTRHDLLAPRVFVFKPRRLRVNFAQYSHIGRKTQPAFDFLELMCSSLDGGEGSERLEQRLSKFYEDVVASVLMSPTDRVDKHYQEVPASPEEISLMARCSADNSPESVRDFVMCDHPVLLPYQRYLSQVMQVSSEVRAGISIEPSSHNDGSNDMLSVLKDLSDDRLASLLYYSVHNAPSVCCLLRDDGVKGVPKLAGLASQVGSNPLLPEESRYSVICRYDKYHTFRLAFHSSFVDDNFVSFHSKATPPKQPFEPYPEPKDLSDPVQRTALALSCWDAIRKSYNLSNSLCAGSVGTCRSDIFSKIAVMSSYNEEDCPSAQRPAYLIIRAIASLLSTTKLGATASHAYEIAKSALASLKTSPHDNQYYVGVNGNYRSITLSRCCSTLDSFKTLSYLTIFRPSSGKGSREHFSHMKLVRSGAVARTKFYTLNPNSLSWEIKKPYLLVGLGLWRCDVRSDTVSSPDIKTLLPFLADSYMHLCSNRDHFAQCVGQTRYMYVSGTGYGNEHEKILAKMAGFRPKFQYELRYVCLSVKMGGVLRVLHKSKSMHAIKDTAKNFYKVSFPHARDVAHNHDEVVSSMFFKNLFMKESAFPQVKDAMAFNVLIEEQHIFETMCTRSESDVNCMSKDTFVRLRSGTFRVDERFWAKEEEHAVSVFHGPQKRFQGSMAFVMSAVATHMPYDTTAIESFSQDLSKGPINLASMHGAMPSGPITMNMQSLRSASSVLCTALEINHIDPVEVNKSILLGAVRLRDAKARSMDCSLLKHLVHQYGRPIDYNARTVKKDEAGPREITIQNGDMRAGTKCVEMFAEKVGSKLPNNVVEAKDKSVRFQNAVLAAVDSSDRLLSDNNDQSRWGPGQLMHMFSAILLVLLRRDIGLYRLLDQVLRHFAHKHLKIPDSLISMWSKGKMSSRSEPIQLFLKECAVMLSTNQPYLESEWGMCQGLMHSLSSLLHSVSSLVHSDIVMRRFTREVDGAPFVAVVVESFVTSDDSTKLICVKDRAVSSLEAFKVCHHVVLGTNNLFNILRNQSKSSFTFAKPELNSEFYDGKSLALPSLKFIISKIDCGLGQNMHEDLMTAITSSQQLMTSGGSYISAVGLTTINLTFHAEHWRLWKSLSNGGHSRPVEAGGLPKIEPLSTVFNTAMSNNFLAIRDFLTADEYAHYMTMCLTAPAEVVRLSDYARVKKVVKEADNVRMLVSSSVSGVISLARSHKKLSQFHRMHSIADWVMPAGYFTLKREDSDLVRFIFVLRGDMMGNRMEDVDSQSWTYKRFADPLVNVSRKVLKYHERSPLSALFPDDEGLFSHNQWVDLVSANGSSNRIVALMRDTLRVELDPAQVSLKMMLKGLFEQASMTSDGLMFEGVVKMSPRSGTSHYVAVPLANLKEIDMEIQQLKILKSACGEASRTAINLFKHDSKYYDSIETELNREVVTLAEGLRAAQDHVEVYRKFFRTNTKCLVSGPEPQSLKLALSGIAFGKYMNNVQVMGKVLETNASTDCRLLVLNPRVAPVQRHSALEELLWVESVHGDTRYEPRMMGLQSRSEEIRPPAEYSLSAALDDKYFVLLAKNRSEFVSRLRCLFGIRVGVLLDDSTVHSMCKSGFISNKEQALTETSWVRGTESHFKVVTSKGERCLTTVQCDSPVGSAKPLYKHTIWVPMNRLNTVLSSSCERSATGWARAVSNRIGENFLATHNRSIRVGDDEIIFKFLRRTNVFTIHRSSHGTAVFLREGGDYIPCYLAGRMSSNLRVDRFSYTAKEVLDGVMLARLIQESVDEAQEEEPDEIPAKMRDVLSNFISKGSLADMDSRNLAALLSAANIEPPASAVSTHALDVAKGVLMHRYSSSIIFDIGRVQHAIGNNFSSSADYYNGVGMLNTSGQLERRGSVDQPDVIEAVREIIVDADLEPIVMIDEEAVFVARFEPEEIVTPHNVLLNRVHDSDEEDDANFGLDEEILPPPDPSGAYVSEEVKKLELMDLVPDDDSIDEVAPVEGNVPMPNMVDIGFNELILRERTERTGYRVRVEGTTSFNESYSNSVHWLVEYSVLKRTMRRVRGVRTTMGTLSSVLDTMNLVRDDYISAIVEELISSSTEIGATVLQLPAPFSIMCAANSVGAAMMRR